jgi:hypothetical protein
MEDWMLGNSLQVTPTGVLLMSLRHLDTVIAISPQLIVSVLFHSQLSF